MIVQQVCPLRKSGTGQYEVQVAIVHHKGLIARYRMGYPTKRKARCVQHLFCAVKNYKRLRVCDELKSLIEEQSK